MAINRNFYKSSRSLRSLRQGDPLSPLFIIVQDALSRRLKHGYSNGALKGYHVPDSSILVSHLIFVDDMLLFTNGGKRSLQSRKYLQIMKWFLVN